MAQPSAQEEHIVSLPFSALVLVLLFFCISSSRAQSLQEEAADPCLNQRCGDIVVRYPFALLESGACPAFSTFFLLSCDTASNQLFINVSGSASAFQVTAITSDSLIVNVSFFRTSFILSNSSACTGDGFNFISLPAFPGPYVISDDNVFVGFGCNQYSIIFTGKLPPAGNDSIAPISNASHGMKFDIGDNYPAYATNFSVGGCCTVCYGEEMPNPFCGDRTCCTSSLALDSPRYALIIFESIGTDPAYTSCDSDHIFGIFFDPNYSDFEKESYQLKLDWALPSDENDEKGILESSNYACSSNSAITLVDGVPGYLCSCQPGYSGDGYLKGSGCTDVNECILGNDCVSGSTCHNEEGNYTCSCDGWFCSGDGRVNGSGCHFSHSILLAIIFGTAGAIVFIVISLSAYAMAWWKRRTKRKYFVQNGGLQFQEVLKGRLGREATRLFTATELESATNNYAEGMKLGAGGSGMVFKGVLSDGKLVAIKRAKNMGSKVDSELFLNEMAILTQINHRHIVRLLGYCLETEVPLLVYEYISNGSLLENLAAMRGSEVVISWKKRLKVAQQAGEALAYLHAAASPPILHRDVKSANVLLDDNFNAKIADFGLSRLIPEDYEQVATAIQGTIGYLDPEYFFTLQLTDKSDVYSFGVMLAELITGLKPVDGRNRDTRFANLALFFVESLRKGSLHELLDPRLRYTSDARSHIHSSIMAVATLAFHCLAIEGSDRPSMNQVSHELRRIADSLQTVEDGQNGEGALLLNSRRESLDLEFELGAAYGSQSSISHLSSFGGKFPVTTLPR